MRVWTTKTRVTKEPLTARTNARPYEGSSCDGFGSGSPTARAPHCLQPLLNKPWNLKPQHGQVVKRLPQLHFQLPIGDLQLALSFRYSLLLPAARVLPCQLATGDRQLAMIQGFLLLLPWLARATCDTCDARRSNRSRRRVPTKQPASDWQRN